VIEVRGDSLEIAAVDLHHGLAPVRWDRVVHRAGTAHPSATVDAVAANRRSTVRAAREAVRHDLVHDGLGEPLRRRVVCGDAEVVAVGDVVANTPTELTQQ
jgi:hypothetical protein